MASKKQAIKNEILEQLKSHGGEIVMGGKIASALSPLQEGVNADRRYISVIVRELANEGFLEIEKPSPDARKYTRIALTNGHTEETTDSIFNLHHALTHDPHGLRHITLHHLVMKGGEISEEDCQGNAGAYVRRMLGEVTGEKLTTSTVSTMLRNLEESEIIGVEWRNTRRRTSINLGLNLEHIAQALNDSPRFPDHLISKIDLDSLVDEPSEEDDVTKRVTPEELMEPDIDAESFIEELEEAPDFDKMAKELEADHGQAKKELANTLGTNTGDLLHDAIASSFVDLFSRIEQVVDTRNEEWFGEASRLEEELAIKDRHIAVLTERLSKSHETILELEERIMRDQDRYNSLRSNYENTKRKLREAQAKAGEASRGETFADKLKLSGRDWKLSEHAKQRAKEMRITQRKVIEALIEPDVVYVSDSDKYGENTFTAKKGPISVAYNDQNSTVITVLWNTTEEYSREVDG